MSYAVIVVAIAAVTLILRPDIGRNAHFHGAVYETHPKEQVLPKVQSVQDTSRDGEVVRNQPLH